MYFQKTKTDSLMLNFPEPEYSSALNATQTFQELYLSFGVLIFGIIVLIIFTVIGSKKTGYTGESMFKSLAMIVIVVGALFLVTAGYGNDQIAPIIGLLGTIAGYLLGGNGNPGPNNNKKG